MSSNQQKSGCADAEMTNEETWSQEAIASPQAPPAAFEVALL